MVASLALCIGCGAPVQKVSTLSGEGLGSASPSWVTLTLNPSTATIMTGQSVALASPFLGRVEWMVNGVVGGDSTNGSIDGKGTYTAPVIPPADWVTVSARLGNLPTNVSLMAS